MLVETHRLADQQHGQETPSLFGIGKHDGTLLETTVLGQYRGMFPGEGPGKIRKRFESLHLPG